MNDDGDKYVTPIQSEFLVYPSMNEVNYTVFGEVTEEYHDELYGFIDGQGWLDDYENGRSQRPYVKEFRDRAGNITGTRLITHTLTHYIRGVQHHPENTNNAKYTDLELARSIVDMQNYP